MLRLVSMFGNDHRVYMNVIIISNFHNVRYIKIEFIKF